MKPLWTLILCTSFILSSLLGMVDAANATPFADVPSNHWAYQAIASLAADGLIEGYSDGQFKGDRPLSRYEMAVLVARVIAKVQASGAGYASKVDLEKLQKLIDALKDELDSLGVRVTNIEDALDALDKRTKLAQSLQLHGQLHHNFSGRQSVRYPHSVANATGAPVDLYYGGSVANTGTATVDPFVDAFLRSPEDNSPLDQANIADYIRFDDRINLAYTVNENLTVSFPIHILNYESGSEFTSGARYSVRPNILINVAKSGNLSNLYLRFGELDGMASSRVGLTYRAPDSSAQGPGFEYPAQSFQQGIQLGGTLNGLTDVQLNFSRVDATLLNTQLNILDSNAGVGLNNYFYYVDRPPATYVQAGAPGSAGGALRSDTFSAANGTLTQVFLQQKAQLGSVYVSQYDGSQFNASAAPVAVAPGGPVAPPAFFYNDNANAVVFAPALPRGSSVGVTYVGLTVSNQAYPQRYDVNLRINQKIQGLPGGEIGLSFNRLFDTDDSATPDITNVGLQNASGYGLVSDSVIGVDAQLPVRFVHLDGDRSHQPVVFAEFASSRFTPDLRSVAPASGAAAVVGLRLHIFGSSASVEYQSVGSRFFDGAPVEYLGNPPQLFTGNNPNYFPGFYGFANNRSINAQYDAANPACTAAGAVNCTLGNPNLTYIYPMFNPFVASGAQYYSAFAPNSTGVTLNVNAPVTIAGLTVNARLFGQHLAEISPNGGASQLYPSATGAGTFVTTKRMTLDKIEAGAQFNLSLLKKRIGINFTGGLERLSRADKTPFRYVPVDPAAPNGTGPALGGVVFYPNYSDVYHTTVAAAASVPLTKDVIFGASYNSQGFHGAYGTTLGQNISERKDTYVGSLTYNIPKTSSSVDFALRNYRYTDFALPTFNNVENREDVNFVIRF